MENQTNVGDQNTQQYGQNTINQPSQIPEKPKINYWIILAVLLFIVLVAGGSLFVLNSKNKISSQQLPANVQANQTVATGVIRTSGLSDEEKQKFGLIATNYQVTDFGDYQKAYKENQIMGYFLLSNNVSDDLLGKCVRVTGIIPEDWKNKNKADAYNRSVLNVANIEKVDNSNCNPYAQTQPAADNTQEKLTLRGTVIHAKRPAPDIGYDYQLKLSEPFVDKFSSAGSPQKVSMVDVTPITNNLWNELENNINKEITVDGYMVWGYAESRYLRIVDIKEIDSTETTKNTSVSYGLFYPYSNGTTINNSRPTIIGKVNQSEQSYLSTKFGMEKSPVSGENEYFLRFLPGKTRNLEVKIDNLVAQNVYGFSQYPTVLCKTINLNPDGTSSYDPQTGKKFPPDDIYTSETECLANKSSDIPPVIFFARPTNQLSEGKHTLTVSSLGKIIGSISFTVDGNYKLVTQNIAKTGQSDYFSAFDTADNCMEGYYYDSNFLKIPLPINSNQNLFYGISFPQTKDEYGSIKRRQVQIGFEGNRFTLFFPQSIVFYDGKSFNNNTLVPEKALFLPKDHLFFTDGKKAGLQQFSPDGGLNGGGYFEVYPIDLSGYEYRGYSLPWQTSGSSGCDG